MVLIWQKLLQPKVRNAFGQHTEINKYTRLVLWACGDLTEHLYVYTYIHSLDDRFPPRFPRSTISRAFPNCFSTHAI